MAASKDEPGPPQPSCRGINDPHALEPLQVGIPERGHEFTLDANEMGNLVASVDLDGNTVEAVVADWMSNNKDRWGSWIK